MSPQSVHSSSRGWQTANQINKRRTSLSRINRRLHNESTTNGVLHGLWDIAPASDATVDTDHTHTHTIIIGEHMANASSIRSVSFTLRTPSRSHPPLHSTTARDSNQLSALLTRMLRCMDRDNGNAIHKEQRVD